MLLTDEQRTWFLETESTGEGAMKFVEMTAKDLEYYISLIHKAAAGFERIDFKRSFERSSTAGKTLSNSSACYREMIVKGRVSQCVKLHYHLTVRNCQATPNFSNNHLDQSEAINNKARLSTRKKKKIITH